MKKRILPPASLACPSGGQGGAEHAEKENLRFFKFHKNIPNMEIKELLSLRPVPARHSHLGDGGRLCGENAGFSLIEVLVAMTIMIVIVVMVTNMFRDASNAWDTGTQRAEMNTAARSAVDYIARELSCAVAGSLPNSAGGMATVKAFLLDNDGLRFTVMSAYAQKLSGVRFKFDNTTHTITTDRYTNDFLPYELVWGASLPEHCLITNVWSFKVRAYTNANDVLTGNSRDSYDSSLAANLLPVCVDLSLEMLGGQNMARALSLSDMPSGSSPRDGFVMTNSRVYTTRVWFPNRGGR